MGTDKLEFETRGVSSDFDIIRANGTILPRARKVTDKLEFAGLRPVLFDIICANGATVPRAHQVTDKLEFAGLGPVLFDIICANGVTVPRGRKVTDKLEFDDVIMCENCRGRRPRRPEKMFAQN